MKNLKSKIFLPITILIVFFVVFVIFMISMFYKYFYLSVQKDISKNYYYSFFTRRIFYVTGGQWNKLVDAPLILDLNQTKVLAENYIKDHEKVYYKNILIPNADAPTFQMIDDDFSQDKNKVYIHGIPFEGIDVETFKKNETFSSYIQDITHIYYFDKIDIANERRLYTSISALPKNYIILSEEYGSVDGFLYYKGKKIENSYAEYFEVLIADSGTIIKTKDYINYLGYMVYGIDTESFRILDSSFYFQDTNAIYFGFEELKDGYGQTIGLTAKSIFGADKNSFEVIKDKEGHFAKDKNHTYERGIIVMKNEI